LAFSITRFIHNKWLENHVLMWTNYNQSLNYWRCPNFYEYLRFTAVNSFILNSSVT
jgi:hypothetical protein